MKKSISLATLFIALSLFTSVVTAGDGHDHRVKSYQSKDHHGAYQYSGKSHRKSRHDHHYRGYDRHYGHQNHRGHVMRSRHEHKRFYGHHYYEPHHYAKNHNSVIIFKLPIKF